MIRWQRYGLVYLLLCRPCLTALTGERFAVCFRGWPPRYYAFNALRGDEECSGESGQFHTRHMSSVLLPLTCSCITGRGGCYWKKIVPCGESVACNVGLSVLIDGFKAQDTVTLLMAALSQSNSTHKTRPNTDYSIRDFNNWGCVRGGSRHGKAFLGDQDWRNVRPNYDWVCLKRHRNYGME